MRFFTIFLLVAMALAQEQGDTSSTTAVPTTIAETTFAETTAEIGTGTVVSFLLIKIDS